jgi:glycosyltransferase involved in cell wall biosynthesis
MLNSHRNRGIQGGTAMKTVCLCMIVKNEEKCLERCLRSTLGLIDTWLICDTGSTDRTRDIIKEFLGHLPGLLVERPWRNFGANRTELMELARGKADYMLLLDADMTVTYGDAAKSMLEDDAYYLRYSGDVEYSQMLLVSGCKEWRYVGVTHEYIHCDNLGTTGQCEDIYVTHYADGGMRADKYERDIRLLLEGLREEPGNSRYVFYLGRSYACLGQWDRALEYYMKCTEMDGWAEEVFYSLWMIARITDTHLGDWAEAQYAFIRAWEFRRHRMEPLYDLILGYRERKEYDRAYALALPSLKAPYPGGDLLFISRWIYTWGLLYEFVISSCNVGDYKGCIQAGGQLLENPDLPEEKKEYVRDCMNYSVQMVEYEALWNRQGRN